MVSACGCVGVVWLFGSFWRALVEGLGLCKAIGGRHCCAVRVFHGGAFSVEERMDGMHMRVVLLLVTSGLVMKYGCLGC